MLDVHLLDRTAAIARDYLGGLNDQHVGPQRQPCEKGAGPSSGFDRPERHTTLGLVIKAPGKSRARFVPWP